jgi:hypothetical protein
MKQSKFATLNRSRDAELKQSCHSQKLNNTTRQ